MYREVGMNQASTSLPPEYCDMSVTCLEPLLAVSLRRVILFIPEVPSYVPKGIQNPYFLVLVLTGTLLKSRPSAVDTRQGTAPRGLHVIQQTLDNLITNIQFNANSLMKTRNTLWSAKSYSPDFPPFGPGGKA